VAASQPGTALRRPAPPRAGGAAGPGSCTPPADAQRPACPAHCHADVVVGVADHQRLFRPQPGSSRSAAASGIGLSAVSSAQRVVKNRLRKACAWNERLRPGRLLPVATPAGSPAPAMQQGVMGAGRTAAPRGHAAGADTAGIRQQGATRRRHPVPGTGAAWHRPGPGPISCDGLSNAAAGSARQWLLHRRDDVAGGIRRYRPSRRSVRSI